MSALASLARERPHTEMVHMLLLKAPSRHGLPTQLGGGRNRSQTRPNRGDHEGDFPLKCLSETIAVDGYAAGQKRAIAGGHFGDGNVERFRFLSTLP